MRILKRVTAILGCVSILMCSFIIPASASNVHEVPFSKPTNTLHSAWFLIKRYNDYYLQYVTVNPDAGYNIDFSVTPSTSNKRVNLILTGRGKYSEYTFIGDKIQYFSSDTVTSIKQISYWGFAGNEFAFSSNWRVTDNATDFITFVPVWTNSVDISVLIPYLDQIVANGNQNHLDNVQIQNQLSKAYQMFIKINQEQINQSAKLDKIQNSLDALLKNNGVPAPTSPNAENEMSQYDDAQSKLPTVPDMELTTDPNLTAGIETNSKFITLLIEKTHMMPFIVFALTMALATFLIGRKVA